MTYDIFLTEPLKIIYESIIGSSIKIYELEVQNF